MQVVHRMLGLQRRLHHQVVLCNVTPAHFWKHPRQTIHWDFAALLWPQWKKRFQGQPGKLWLQQMHLELRKWLRKDKGRSGNWTMVEWCATDQRKQIKTGEDMVLAVVGLCIQPPLT
jgi:hypothetical protein